ncbi:MAG: hypothetical protein WCK51_01220 [Armatimonadota bacterium]
MIDPQAELTPGLRGWYDHRRAVLGEIGVWLPLGVYGAAWVYAAPRMVAETSFRQVLANADQAGVMRLLPISGTVLHLVGIALAFVAVSWRSFPRMERFQQTVRGILISIAGSFCYIEFSGSKFEGTSGGLFMTKVYFVMGFVFLGLWIWKFIDLRMEQKA